MILKELLRNGSRTETGETAARNALGEHAMAAGVDGEADVLEELRTGHMVKVQQYVLRNNLHMRQRQW